MKRFTFAILALCCSALLLCGCLGGGDSGILGKLPGLHGFSGYMPATGACPGLEQATRLMIYRGKEMERYLGKRSAMFRNYGATSLAVAEYLYGGANNSLTIESYVMDSDISAAGLFHYYRGRVLRNMGTPLDIGSEGVIDSKRGGRNMYFYKKRQFVKIIYTGPEPVPDLPLLAKTIAEGIPGKTEKPKGFQYLDVKGVEATTAKVTPGYTFNCDFLPPGVFAEAPGAGPVAELFIISHNDYDESERTARDYRTYLSLNGKNYTVRHTSSRRIVWWARDPDQGRVICSRYKAYVVGVLRPKTYQHGELLIDRVIENMKAKK